MENVVNKELTARSGEFQSPETDIIQGLVIENHTLVSILDKLMNRQSSIIRLNNCIRHLWRRKHRECQHHSIWVFFSNLRYQ